MSTTTIKIEDLVQWSEGKRIDTRNGRRILHTAEPTETFWAAWHTHKEELRAEGVSCGRDQKSGEWQACWWKPLPPEELKQIAETIEASQQADATIEIPKPDNGMDFFGYQKAGVSFALKAWRYDPNGKPTTPGHGVMIGDDMGLGKTIQAIGVFNAIHDIKRVLVVCPSAVKVNWKREWAAWSSRPSQCWPVMGKDWPSIADVVLINYDVLHKHERELLGQQWDLVIVDEFHFLKEMKTRRWKCFEKIKARYRLALSGTPILNQIDDIFPILHWLDPEQFKNIYSFRYKFSDKMGNSSKDQRMKLQSVLRSKLMCRRLKADVLKDLPPKRRSVIEVPDTVGAVRLEEEAFESNHINESMVEALEAAVELAKVSDDPAEYEKALRELTDSQHIPFDSMARVRHQTALMKVPVTIEHLRTCFESGIEKIVCFAHHRDCIEGIEAAFPGAVHYYGGMDEVAKDAAIQEFMNNPKCPLWVGSIRAGGMGINGLQTVCSHMVFHELDWVPLIVNQAEDRLARLGQKESVLVQHIVLEGSIDANLASKCVHKQRLSDETLDTDRDRLLNEPLTPARRKTSSVTLTEREMEQATIDPAQKAAVHQALRMLSGVCDGARATDEMGFNGVDTRIGKSLAGQSFLTDRQGILGRKLIRKYRRQLPADLLEKAGVKTKEEKETV